MKANLCLGCHTYFQEGQRVALESMTIQFKNYFLPIKESKQKWILLKTLVGFLNSKGGTIYIGIQDNEGKVIGQQIKRKQQDQFLLFIKGLADKIVPAVDFVNKEEIVIVYVPVVSNKVFKGKYIIKIIVKQGDPSKTYHFSQCIQLEFKGKIDKYDIFHAFYRHNMGGIVQVKGEPLLEQIARKAVSPNQIANTFHKFCNPQPLKLGGALTKIGFSGIRKEELRNKLEQIFHNNLQTFDIEYELTYDIENQVLLIELQNEDQFKKINNYMRENLSHLNQGGLFNFTQKGEYLDFYLYKNIVGKRELSPSNNSNSETNVKPKTKSTTEKKGKIPQPQQKLQQATVYAQFQNNDQKQQEQVQQKKQEPIKEVQKVQVKVEAVKVEAPTKQKQQVWQYAANDNWESGKGKKQTKEEVQKDQNEKLKQKELCDKYLSKEFVLTITHIFPAKRQELEAFLKQLSDSKYEFITQKYTNTIELVFQNRESVIKFHQIITKNNEKLSKFGVYGNLVIGINMKSIRISNYNSKKRKQLKQFIQKKLKKDCDEIQFKKSNNKFFLECHFKTRQLSCQCLDTILSDNSITQFNIPETQSSKPGKVRVYIYCICE